MACVRVYVMGRYLEMSVYALPADIDDIKENADDANQSVSEYVRTHLPECGE